VAKKQLLNVCKSKSEAILLHIIEVFGKKEGIAMTYPFLASELEQGRVVSITS
jgi:hypothetical protein